MYRWNNLPMRTSERLNKSKFNSETEYNKYVKKVKFHANNHKKGVQNWQQKHY